MSASPARLVCMSPKVGVGGSIVRADIDGQITMGAGPSQGFGSRGAKNQKGGATFLKYNIGCI